MQVKNLISRLEQMMPFMSEKEKRIARFVLENRQQVLSLTLKEISTKTEVSEATIIRFARKIGCDGYADFKIALSASLSTNSVNEKSDPMFRTIQQTDSPGVILEKISALTISSIYSTIDIIDKQQLAEAVKLIRKTHESHHRIYLSGSGASAGPVKEMIIKFMRLNIPVIYHEDSHIQLESNLNMEENDLLICFTTLGRSIQSHQYIDIANQKKAKVILITQFGNLELEKQATVTLSVASLEDRRRLVSQTALIVQSLIVNTLFTSLALEKLPELENKIEEKNIIFDELGYIAGDHR